MHYVQHFTSVKLPSQLCGRCDVYVMLLRQRVEANGEWSLFCPSEAPGLADTWGAEFEALYAKYEAEGRAKKVIRAQSLWFAIMDAQASVVTSDPVAMSISHLALVMSSSPDCVVGLPLATRGGPALMLPGIWVTHAEAASVIHFPWSPCSRAGPTDGVTGGDGQPVHAVQGQLQQEEQSAESGAPTVSSPLCASTPFHLLFPPHRRLRTRFMQRRHSFVDDSASDPIRW